MVSNIQDRLNRAVRPGYGMKTPVLCASTGNIGLTSTNATIDGVTPSSGDRILVWQQTNTYDNGVYNYGNSTWERALDFDGNSDVVLGTLVPISTGATYAARFAEVRSTGSGLNGGINFAGSSTSDDITFRLSTPFSGKVGSTVLPDSGVTAGTYGSSLNYTVIAVSSAGVITGINAGSNITGGNWTVFDGSTASLSFTNTSGTYKRIDDQVWAHFRATYPATTNAGQAGIGLPFKADFRQAPGYMQIAYTDSTISPIYFSPSQQSTFGLFYTAGGAAIFNSTFSGKDIRGVIYFRTTE